MSGVVETRVSIVVPVYNTEPYLVECLDSLCAQEAPGIEIILVDDGSTDGSGEICDAYAAKDPRVTVIHQGNQGLSQARNVGMAQAHGEWLMFADSDDAVREGFVSIPLGLAAEHGCDIVVFDFDRCDAAGFTMPESMQTFRMHRFGSFSRVEAMKALAKHEVFDFAWNKLYRRELFDGVQYPAGERWEDMAVSYILFDHARSIYFAPDRLYRYRDRPDSLSREDYRSAIEVVCKRAFDALEYVSANCPEAYGPMAIRCAQEEVAYLRTHVDERGTDAYEAVRQRLLTRSMPAKSLGKRYGIELAALRVSPVCFSVVVAVSDRQIRMRNALHAHIKAAVSAFRARGGRRPR